MNNIRILYSNTNKISQLYSIRLGSDYFPKLNVSSCSIRCFSDDKGSHSPSTFEKYMLVWMKKYPSVADVPKTVSSDTMRRTRDWARIKLNIIFCGLTAVGCLFVVYLGKQAAKRGESIQKMNVKWHEEQSGKKE